MRSPRITPVYYIEYLVMYTFLIKTTIMVLSVYRVPGSALDSHIRIELPRPTPNL